MEGERASLTSIKCAYLGSIESSPESVLQTAANKSRIFKMFHAENKIKQDSKKEDKVKMRLSSNMLDQVNRADVLQYPPQPEGENPLPCVSEVINTNDDYYILFASLNFQSGENIEIRQSFTYDDIVKDNLAMIICSLLNTGKTCSVFYGLNAESRVLGVHLSRKKRQNFLHYIGSQMRRIVPIVLPISYDVIFTPVFKSTEPIDLKTERLQVIVEIRLKPVRGVLYSLNAKCYLRDGTSIFEPSAEEIDEWALKEEKKIAKINNDFKNLLLGGMSERKAGEKAIGQ